MSDKSFEKLLDILFESAQHSCCYVKEKYHQEIFKGALHYAFEKLSDGEMRKKEIIVKVYQKWSGLVYDSDSFDEIEDNYDGDSSE
jgi:hypothetical protein